MAETLDSNERFTGQKATLKFRTPESDTGARKTYELQISNVSWSRDTGTTDVQHNDSLKATKALTDIRFSGSFEYSGQNFDAINALLYATDGASPLSESSEPVRGTLTVKEQDPNDEETAYVYTFKNTVVTSQSRDLPADDVASTTYDWEAEDMSVYELDDGAKDEPGHPADL